jgi:hypothetical protein
MNRFLCINKLLAVGFINWVPYDSSISSGINLKIKGFVKYKIITSAYCDPTESTY